MPGRPTVPFLRAVFPAGLHLEFADVFESGYVGAGDRVEAFEVALRRFLGAPEISVTSSCTAALTLAYVAAGVQRDTSVLSTPMTCAAANIPLLQLGARVHWLDVDPQSGNATARSVAAALERHPDARLVVVMDWGGVPCDSTGIAEVCRRAGATLVLDAAQSFGATFEGDLYRRGPDYVCYSFGPTKILSSIEGGAVGSPASDAERLRALRWYGIVRQNRDLWRFWDYEVTEPGYRSISNELFATVGLGMLQRFEDRLRLHRTLAGLYDERLQEVPGLTIARRPAASQPNSWLYTVLAERRSDLLAKLHAQGFHAATPHRRNDVLLERWCPQAPEEAVAGVAAFDASYLCLPIGPWVQPADVDSICTSIRSGW